jgi:predicted histidine transporter YuiF (NhaC family)
MEVCEGGSWSSGGDLLLRLCLSGSFCSVVLVCHLYSPIIRSLLEDDGEEVLMVGMLNAIQGIGAGGSRASDTSLVAKGNAALYSCFAVFGIFSGSVINTIGPKIPLMLYVPLLSSRQRKIR